jgi:Hemopexin
MSLLLNKNGLFLFHGDTYLYLDLAAKEVGDRQKTIQMSFNIPFSTVDAALRWNDETVFFFKGMDCLRYDLTSKSVAPRYPKKILFEWKGIWPTDISDAVLVGDKVYFFRRTQFIVFDVNSARAETGYPRPLTERWPGVWESIDGVECLERDQMLFLKDDQVMQYDMNLWKMTPPYARKLDDFVKSYRPSNNGETSKCTALVVR